MQERGDRDRWGVRHSVCALTWFTVWAVSLAPNAAGAVDLASTGERQGRDGPARRGTIELHYERDLLSAQITDAPLAEVLAALRRLPRVQLQVIGAPSGDRPVTVTVHPVPIVEGVRTILREISYVLELHEAGMTVHALLGPTGGGPTPRFVAEGDTSLADTAREPSPADTEREASLAPAGAERQVSPTEAAGERVASLAASPEVPTSGQGELSADPAEGLGDPVRDEFRSQLTQAAPDARLAQALSALSSRQAEVHAEALDEIAYSSDVRAIDTLTEAALGLLHVAPAIRVQAAAALARHALQAAPSDRTLVPLLEQLARDGDNRVQAVARQTLKDLEQ